MKAEQTGCGQPEDNGKHRRKWEKHVLQGGLTWKFLWMGSRIKKALRRKRLTEQDLLAALSGEEQARLAALLDKLSGILG
ncbi:MAG: hypothetical protein IJ313_00330 [Clostridia bacterium]|nr:hypothetical protein [Clostridia bacterium]